MRKTEDSTNTNTLEIHEKWFNEEILKKIYRFKESKIISDKVYPAYLVNFSINGYENS